MKPPLMVACPGHHARGAHLGSAPPSRERVKYTPYPVNISHRTYNRPLDREYSKRRWQFSTRGSTRRPAHSTLRLPIGRMRTRLSHPIGALNRVGDCMY